MSREEVQEWIDAWLEGSDIPYLPARCIGIDDSATFYRVAGFAATSTSRGYNYSITAEFHYGTHGDFIVR